MKSEDNSSSVPFYRGIASRNKSKGLPPYRNSPAYSGTFNCFNESPESGSQLINRIQKGHPAILEEIKSKTVLDLGCGCGSAFVYELKQMPVQPNQIIYCDADANVFRAEKSVWRGGLDHDLMYSWGGDVRMVADAHDLPFESDSIDIVHQKFMFDDNDGFDRQKIKAIDEARIISEISRVLRVGGYFLDIGVNAALYPCENGGSGRGLDRHYDCHNRDCIPLIYKENGLQVLFSEFDSHPKRRGLISLKI